MAFPLSRLLIIIEKAYGSFHSNNKPPLETSLICPPFPRTSHIPFQRRTSSDSDRSCPTPRQKKALSCSWRRLRRVLGSCGRICPCCSWILTCLTRAKWVVSDLFTLSMFFCCCFVCSYLIVIVVILSLFLLALVLILVLHVNVIFI